MTNLTDAILARMTPSADQLAARKAQAAVDRATLGKALLSRQPHDPGTQPEQTADQLTERLAEAIASRLAQKLTRKEN